MTVHSLFGLTSLKTTKQTTVRFPLALGLSGLLKLPLFSRRLIVAAFDLTCCFVLACLIVCSTTDTAYAYVDPSVMTYTIQAVAGVAVALSAVLGVAMRRTRKKLLALLNIDENRNKTVEGPVHRVDSEGRIIAHSYEKTADFSGTANASYGKTTDKAAPAAAQPASVAAKTSHAAQAHDAAASTANAAHDAAASTANAAHDAAAAPQRSGKTAPKHAAKQPRQLRPLSWKRRVVLALVASIFFVFTLFGAAPLEIVGGSSASLIFGITHVVKPVLLACAVLTAILTLILSLLRGRAFNIVLLLVIGLGLCCYVQAIVLNTGLPLADGDAVKWDDYTFITVISAAVWIALIVGILIVGHIRPNLTQGLGIIVAVALTIVQGVGVASLFASTTTNPLQGKDVGDLPAAAAVTEEGLFQVSSTNNFVLFVLDTFDTNQLIHLTEQDPTVLDNFTDFTWFKNTGGSMIPTWYAVPFLLTGEQPHEGERIVEYNAQRYLRSPLLRDIHDAGYSIGLYTDAVGLGWMTNDEAHTAIIDNVINISSATEIPLNVERTLIMLAKCALYRDAPWVAKPYFWFYTDEINQAMTYKDESEDEGDQAEPYVIDDVKYYNELRDKRLTVSDDTTSGAFRLIHLLGAHYPFSYDENVNWIGVDESTQDAQAIGSLHIVNEYLQQLRDLGVYDNTTVVITADHGHWYLTDEPLTVSSAPILLVKPAKGSSLEQDAQTAGDTASTLGQNANMSLVPPPSDDPAYIPSQRLGAAGPIVSNAPVSHMDFQATLYDALGLDASIWGPNFFEIPNEPRRRIYYTTNSNGTYNTEIVQYAIEGDANDINDWHLTGARWDAVGG